LNSVDVEMETPLDDKLLDLIDTYWDRLRSSEPKTGLADSMVSADTKETAGAYFHLLRELEEARQMLKEDSGFGAERVQSPANDPHEIPQQFGRYQVLRQIGQGGMGAVFLAHDSVLGRNIALKVPYFSTTDDRLARDRFQREARAAATLRHPNICPVYDIGEIDEIPFLTMAFIDGRPLAARRIPAEDRIESPAEVAPLVCASVSSVNHDRSHRLVVVLVRKLARALQHAHAHGVVHRDLKPSNILLDRDGEPVIVDFGLAMFADLQNVSLTQRGAILGTPAYMSPEQAMADHTNIGPASDIYSLGVIFYELLTGRLPYREPRSNMLAQILSPEPLKLDAEGVALEPGLHAICARALAKRPNQRFGSMAEFADALDDCLKEAAPARGPNERRQSAARRMRWVGSAILAGVLACGVVLAVVLQLQTPDGTLVVQVNEPGTKVTVVNERGYVEIVRAVSGETLKLSIDPGKHRIKVEKEGFTVFAKEFSIASGEMEPIKATLLPLPTNYAESYEALHQKLDLAVKSLREKNYAKAESFAYEAWQGRLKTLGADHYHTIDAESIFGEILAKQHKFKEAEQHLLASYAAMSNAKASRPEWIPVYESRLIDLYTSWGKRAEAEKWRNMSVANGPSQIAKQLEVEEKYAQAAEAWREVWQERQKRLGADDRLTIDAEHWFGFDLAQSGKYEEAEQHLLASYDKLSKAKNAPSAWLRDYKSRVAWLYKQWGKTERQVSWLDAYVKTAQALLESQQPDTRVRSDELWKYGNTMAQLDDYSAAEIAFRECLQIREKLLPGHWKVFSARARLGWSLLGQQRYEEAEPLLLSAYEGLAKFRSELDGENRSFVVQAAKRLAELYEAQGRSDLAEKWSATCKAEQQLLVK
jgi:tRNA A-37 threonylcarbamoyl transferase component Bud32